MNCAWQEYLAILPHRFRNEIDRIGKNTLLETRLRLGKKPTLITSDGVTTLSEQVNLQDLLYSINAASEYSPWSVATTADGYITVSGGHRVGICGCAVTKDNKLTGFRTPYSLSLRVARNFNGISSGLEKLKGSTLILGSPGSGKTTLLRDLIYRKSQYNKECISVVDERQELFPYANNWPIFDPGDNTDILSGSSKIEGVSITLRNMSPSVIALDEITHPRDCEAIMQAAWCGVSIIATAHAGSKDEFYKRIVYKPLIDCGVFQNLVLMRKDKSWFVERIPL